MSTTSPSVNESNSRQTQAATQRKRQNPSDKLLHPVKSHESRGRKRKTGGKPRKELPLQDSQLLAELKAGKTTRELAMICGVSQETIRNRLEQYDRKAYKQIARARTSPKSDGQRRELPVPDSELHEQWKNGMSMRELATKYKVSRQTIRRRLREFNEQEQREIANRKIADSIAKRRKNLPVPPEAISVRYADGESASELAAEFNVSRPTITRLLERCGREDYEETAKQRILTGRTRELLIPISVAFDMWEKGETPENLENLCGISYRQLLEKLKAYDPVRYKRVAERRGLGSARAKPYGARSLFELNVRRVLEKHGIHTRETTLKLNNHNYRPDCLIVDKRIIIEAMGLSAESYWKRNDRKTRDYIRYEYKTIAVVPNEQLYKKAKRYLCRKVIILRYSELDNFATTFLGKALSEKDS